MRKLFIISTAIFWLAVAGFWLANRLHVPAQTDAVATIAEPALRSYSLAEVKLHNLQTDCWMAIDEQVYDITAYLPSHPTNPEVIEPWCGKEASQAWQSKTIGRPHSPRAHELLHYYHIGKLRQTH